MGIFSFRGQDARIFSGALCRSTMGIAPAKPRNKTPDEFADRLWKIVDFQDGKHGDPDTIDRDWVFNIPDSAGVGKFPIFLPGLENFF